MISVKVGESQAGERIDRFLQAHLKDYSRTDIQKLIVAGSVLFDGKPVSKNLRIESDMEIQVLTLPEKEDSNLEPEYIPLNIVYEDDDIVIINKPRRLVVHPGSGIWQTDRRISAPRSGTGPLRSSFWCRGTNFYKNLPHQQRVGQRPIPQTLPHRLFGWYR